MCPNRIFESVYYLVRLVDLRRELAILSRLHLKMLVKLARLGLK